MSDSKEQPESVDDSGSSACYTPGPWFAHLNGNGAWCVKNGEDYDSSYVVASRNQVAHRVMESEANARLIAAAPELLKALQDIVSHQELIGGNMPSSTKLIAVNAISKAV